MPRACSVCIHPERPLIDRLVSEGTGTVRVLAERFGLSTGAVHRHYDHIRRQVTLAVQRQQDRTGLKLASKWADRLDLAYSHAETGIDETKAEGPKGWEGRSRFLGVQLKAIELGLKADGVIDGGKSNAVTNNTQFVIALPRGPVELPLELPAETDDAIEVSAIESGDYEESDIDS